MTIEEENKIIGNIPFLKDFNQDQLAEFIAAGQMLDFEKNQLIFNDGDPGQTMYIILSGSIEIFKQNKQIAIRGPGDYFGEMAMIESKPRSAGARTLKDTRLFEIGREVFDRFLNSNTQIVKQFLQTISSRCRVDLDIIDTGYLQLFKSEERYRTIVETISDLVFQLDPDGKIEFINSAIQVLGYEPGDLIGKHVSALLKDDGSVEDLLTKRIGPRATTNCEVTFQVNRESPISEFVDEMYFLVDAHGVWNVRNDLVMKKGSNKKFLGTLCIARDFTEKKKEQERLEKRKEELEILVKERTQVLEQAKKEAEFANQAKTEFLSRVSHELRTPLNAIIGFSELIVESGIKTSREKIIEFAANILKSGKHLLSLVTEILDLSRIESNSIEIDIVDIDLVVLVSNLLYLMAPDAARRKVEIINSTPEQGSLHVKADDLKLKQVVLNLLSNAIKYNRENGKVEIRLRKTPNQTAILEVEDTGLGIAEEDARKVFEPFQRMNWEYSDVEGTGIGLTLSRRMMGLMKGSIGFKSAQGKGSCFFIELPLANPDVNRSPKQDQRAAPSGTRADGKRTVLYIEDEPANIALVEAVFSDTDNIQLISAKTAEEGIALTAKLKPDLILLDILLPGVDGFGALKELRKLPGLNNVPVIALTAQAMKEDIDRIRQSGFDDYITKPLQILNLKSMVSHFLK